MVNPADERRRISGFSGGDPLVILYANDLTVTRQRRSAGAKIVTAMSWRCGWTVEESG
jgi:hypothetical protein